MVLWDFRVWVLTTLDLPDGSCDRHSLIGIIQLNVNKVLWVLASLYADDEVLWNVIQIAVVRNVELIVVEMLFIHYIVKRQSLYFLVKFNV